MSKAVFILDNHSSHTSEKSKTLMREYGIDFIYLPPYSSELNPIESVWAVLKNSWRKWVMS